MKNYDIVLIDTGISQRYLRENSLEIDVLNLNGKSNEDFIGHGTAVFSIFNSQIPDAKILCMKIPEDSQVEDLISIFDYIYNYVDCKMIHLSLGITQCDNISELYSVCKKLYDKNVIMVAAFSNDGSISYPAAFDIVVGVDISLNCRHIYEYEYVDSPIINIRAFAFTQTLPFTDGKPQKCSGTSFSAPYISSYIYKYIKSKDSYSLSDIHFLLKKGAKKEYPSVVSKMTNSFHIDKAIAFPFNKEIHSLARYSNFLYFNLENIYDVKYLRNIGKQISTLFHKKFSRDYTIQNYMNIDWNDNFDTLILGHTRELSALLNIDLKMYFYQKCIEYKKNIFSFDDLSDIYHCSKIKVYSPQFTIPDNHFGKLYHIGKPIICIVGTSSKQGKFSTQVCLRNAFESRGYKVGQLGTEPSSELFGFDAVFPNGYDSNINISWTDEIVTINYLLHEIEIKNPDVIIVGTQSQSYPFSFGNVRYLPVKQNSVLYAINADAYILTCNYFDEIEYIEQTLNFIESINNSKVIAINLFPIDSNLQWSVFAVESHIVSEEMLNRKKEQLYQKFHIPVIIQERENDQLCEICIECFS